MEYDQKSFAVLGAALKENSRCALNGILFEKDGSTVASNTYVLAKVTPVGKDEDNEQSFICPVDTAKEVTRLVRGAKQPTITLIESCNNRIVFQSKSGNSVSALFLEGQFPRYQEIFKAAHEGEPCLRISLDVKVLKTALSVMEKFNKDGLINMEFRGARKPIICTLEGTGADCKVARTLEIIIMPFVKD